MSGAKVAVRVLALAAAAGGFLLLARLLSMAINKG